jgi:hypothetical protein
MEKKLAMGREWEVGEEEKPRTVSTRQELADRYFSGMDIYAKDNLGIISLLSDLQHIISDKHYIQILNDIKCILVMDIKLVQKDGPYNQYGD